MKRIKLFFKNLRNAWFEARVEREIYNRMFPHLEREKDYGYPFASDEEFERQLAQNGEDVRKFIAMFEERAAGMPEAYGKAFSYIMYRELKPILARYESMMKRRMQPKHIDPRLVARPAMPVAQ